MISITRFQVIITTYAKLGKDNDFPVIFGCRNCGYEGKLHRHGFYQRYVITPYEVFKIFILRVKCPSCNKTYSLIPNFLIPHHQYCFEHIFLCLYYYFIKGYSYLAILDVFKALNPNTSFSTTNVYFIRKRMIDVAPYVNLFFANFDDMYFDMEKPSVSCIVGKIELFLEREKDFNLTYFDKMPTYFFKKIS
jgi:hypothetical protein